MDQAKGGVSIQSVGGGGAVLACDGDLEEMFGEEGEGGGVINYAWP